MKKPRIQNVIFDAGGVLFEWNPEAIVERRYSDPALARRVLSGVFEHPDWRELDRDALTESEASGRFARRTGLPAAEMAHLIDDARESLIPIPESFTLVEELSAAGFSLFVLSNMPVKTFGVLKARYGLWDRFQGVVISGELKISKPDERVYRHLFSKFNLDPAQCLYLDDSPANVVAARNLSMNAILFRDAEQCRAELKTALRF